MTYEDFKKTVTTEFPDMSEGQMAQFEALEPLYREWNSRINVISRKDMDGIYDHHVLHSLAIASYWIRRSLAGPDSAFSVLDLGTGGGFPGIPLAIMFPRMQFTLCDSIGKKVLVAGEVASALGLKNVQTVNARAETLPETFDFVVSRAVTSLDKFYPWVKGKFRGSIFYLKGGDINEEICTMMRRERMQKGSVSTWRLDEWLQDEWYKEKFVIQIDR